MSAIAAIAAILGQGNGVVVPTVPLTVKIVTDGHSMLTDYGDTAAASVEELLAAAYPSYTHANFAVPGQTLTQIEARSATTLAAYDGTKDKNILILWPVINSLVDSSVDMPALKAIYEGLISDAVTAGFEVVTLCETQARGGPYAASYPTVDTRQLEINDWLEDNRVVLAISVVVKSHTDFRLVDATNSTYFVDGIHMNLAGREVVAGMLSEAIQLALIGQTGIVEGQTS